MRAFRPAGLALRAEYFEEDIIEARPIKTASERISLWEAFGNLWAISWSSCVVLLGMGIFMVLHFFMFSLQAVCGISLMNGLKRNKLDKNVGEMC